MRQLIFHRKFRRRVAILEFFAASRESQMIFFFPACNYFWLRSLNSGPFLSELFLQLVEQVYSIVWQLDKLLTGTVIWFATLVMAQGKNASSRVTRWNTQRREKQRRHNERKMNLFPHCFCLREEMPWEVLAEV